jgi:hypothetical protein
MQLTLLHGYPDFVGLRCTWCGYGNGPTSLPAAGDPISLPRYNYYIDSIGGEFVTVSGTYEVTGQPSAVGARATWTLTWRFATAGSVASATATAGTGQTPGTYLISGTSGGGTGAQISVTVAAGGTVTATPIVVNPGKNYTSVPTFTVAAGGTPSVITPVLSTEGGIVATGTNLSAEQVQISGFGGQY